MSCKFSFFILLFVTIIANVSAQNNQTTITGKVIDSETNQPLVNCNISILNTEQGTVTDSFGFFTISLKNRNSTLKFSFVGYETFKYSISFKENELKDYLLIKLKPKTIKGDEVKVVAERSISSTILQNVKPILGDGIKRITKEEKKIRDKLRIYKDIGK